MATKLLAKSPKLVTPGPLKGVLFGLPGSGKSWTALSFEKAYLIDVEHGASLPQYTEKLLQSGGAYMGPNEGSTDFDTVISQIIALSTEPHNFRTVIIDSISKLFDLEVARETERLGSKVAFGNDKKPAVMKMRRLVSWIGRLPLNCWLICHETSSWGVDGTGQRSEIGKKPSIWDGLIYELDLCLQVRAHSAKRRDAVVFKSRLSGFPINDVIILQENGKDVSYDAISSRYGKDYLEAIHNPITLATAEQTDILKKLFERLQLSDEQIGKALAKRGAESIEELNADEAESIIIELKKRIEV